MPPLANRGKRLVARIIDLLLIWVPVGLAMYAIVGGYDPADADDNGKAAIVQGVVVLAYLLYEGLMLASSGQTVGKKVMNIRVALLENGAVPAGSPAWIRACVYILPVLVPCCGWPVFWLVNVLWCTWDKPYQQCLHDKAAKTVVVEAG
ncbi:RDD family protein [Streptomyces sp. KR80]|uniref:RDD family protein n=1 Tax=Streptomyces sp. KR80 TaxID=3457426 RepID=UPI003FD142E9